jgi:hypothetical protein
VFYVVGEVLRLCHLETSPVSSILQWFARCGTLFHLCYNGCGYHVDDD